MQVYEEKTHNVKLQTKTNKVYIDHTEIQAKDKHVDYTDLHEGKAEFQWTGGFVS